jgi:hypothetical protein
MIDEAVLKSNFTTEALRGRTEAHRGWNIRWSDLCVLRVSSVRLCGKNKKFLFCYSLL